MTFPLPELNEDVLSGFCFVVFLVDFFFFNTTNTIVVEFHYACIYNFLFCKSLLKKKIEEEVGIWGCEKDRLALITCFCLFALVTILQCKDFQFSSGILGSLSLYFFTDCSC